MDPIAQRLVDLSQSETKSAWFGGAAKSNHALQKDEVSKVLLKEIYRLVGDTALDGAERVAFETSLNPSDDSRKGDVDREKMKENERNDPKPTRNAFRM